MRPQPYAELLMEVILRDDDWWTNGSRELAPDDPVREPLPDGRGHAHPIGWWLRAQSFPSRCQETRPLASGLRPKLVRVASTERDLPGALGTETGAWSPQPVSRRPGARWVRKWLPPSGRLPGTGHLTQNHRHFGPTRIVPGLRLGN